MHEDKDGYLTYRNPNLISSIISRCVYYYFIGDIPKGMQIDHIDRNKKNNNLSNLRIVSSSTNNINKENYKICLFHNLITKKTYITDNISEFSKENHLERGNLYKLIKKEAKQYRNWIGKEIEHIEDNINFISEVDYREYDISDISVRINNRFATVIAVDINSNKSYMFSDKSKFCKVFDINRDSMLKCLNGKYSQSKGFTFKYDYNIEIIGDNITEIS